MHQDNFYLLIQLGTCTALRESRVMIVTTKTVG